MEQKRLAPELVHRLPGAPSFAGRSNELDELDQFWQSGPGVLSLVGVGGAGKTALCERFVSRLLDKDAPDGLFVWSFYDEPDANAFLRAAYQYFSGSSQIEATGAGWFHALKEALASGGKFVLVLDGLERIQRPTTEARGVFGELEDPLLKGLLRRLVAGVGQTKVLITSRFPVSDLEPWLGKGYRVLDVDQLDVAAALSLLKSRGVKSTETELASLMLSFGRHALTLDLLAGAIDRFFQGDATKVDPIRVGEESAESLQAQRLSHTLNIYLEKLDKPLLDLMTRLCIFRFGVTAQALKDIFLKDTSGTISGSLGQLKESQLKGLLEDLTNMHLAHESGDLYTVHPAVRDHFYRLFREPGSIHGAVSSHLMSLTGRPGVGLPVEKEALDLLEELVYHAIKADQLDEAMHVYVDRMGANDHLNVQLGEYGRTFRILKAFPHSPDPSGMYHCMRAFGRFDDALEWRPQNRYILLITGRLAKLAKDPAERASRVAWYLRGEPVSLPDRLPDFPLSIAWLHLYRDMLEDARRSALAEINSSLFADDAMRNRIALAEAERRLENLNSARVTLEESTKWVLSSSSHEHLCLYHGVRARMALDEGQFGFAWSAAEEAMQIAQESDFELYRVDHLVTGSRIRAAQNRLDEAVALGTEALELSLDPEMGFVWGEKEARLAIAHAKKLGEDVSGAAEQLGKVLELQRRIDDPQIIRTERLLAELSRSGREQ